MQVLHTTVKIERSTESKSHLRSLLNCIVSKPKLKLHMALISPFIFLSDMVSPGYKQ